MKEFIIVMLSVSVVSGFALMLVPEGRGGGLRACLNFVTGLCALSVTVGPLLDFVGSLKNYESESCVFESVDVSKSYEEIFYGTIAAEEEGAVAEGLKALIIREFLIEERNLTVEVELDVNKEHPESVTVTLFGKGMLADGKGICDYVEALLNCECTVVYGEIYE